MTKAMYNARELAEVLGCSESKSYQLIKLLNEELQKDGYLIIRGKIPIGYVNKRFFGMKEGGSI